MTQNLLKLSLRALEEIDEPFALALTALLAEVSDEERVLDLGRLNAVKVPVD